MLLFPHCKEEGATPQGVSQRYVRSVHCSFRDSPIHLLVMSIPDRGRLLYIAVLSLLFTAFSVRQILLFLIALSYDSFITLVALSFIQIWPFSHIFQLSSAVYSHRFCVWRKSVSNVEHFAIAR